MLFKTGIESVRMIKVPIKYGVERYECFSKCVEYDSQAYGFVSFARIGLKEHHTLLRMQIEATYYAMHTQIEMACELFVLLENALLHQRIHFDFCSIYCTGLIF